MARLRRVESSRSADVGVRRWCVVKMEDPRRRAELLADENDTAAAWERDATKRMDRPAENFIVVVVVVTNRLIQTLCATQQEVRGNNQCKSLLLAGRNSKARYLSRFSLLGGGGLQA